MRVRYTKSSDAPKLLDAAAALGVNDIDLSKASEAEKLAAISKLQDDTASYTNSETNLFLEAFANKVLISKIFKRMKFKDPLTKAFFTEGTNFKAAKEVFDSKLLEDHDFNPNKRYPDDQTKAKNLTTILTTAAKKYITNTVQIAGLQAAFASEAAYGSWVALQVDLLQETLQIKMFKALTTNIKGSIKNEITLDKAKFDTWDKIFIEITRIANNMQLPSVKYNLGFADPTDAANADKVRMQVTTMDKLYAMGSPDVQNALKGQVSTVKFHNEYFKLEKFKDYINLDTTADNIMLVAHNAFEGHFRVNQVATQNWAANLSLEYFLHYWYVFGAIPWAIGVKINFTNPDA